MHGIQRLIEMKKSLSCLDKIVILCRNIEKTTGVYCEALGLKVVLQSPQLVQLRDANDLTIFLKTSNIPSHLHKGYSPILSFRVEFFDQVHQKLILSDLMQDGETIQTPKGKMASFLGLEGEHICINNFKPEQQEIVGKTLQEEDSSSAQIKNLLSKIKL